MDSTRSTRRLCIRVTAVRAVCTGATMAAYTPALSGCGDSPADNVDHATPYRHGMRTCGLYGKWGCHLPGGCRQRAGNPTCDTSCAATRFARTAFATVTGDTGVEREALDGTAARVSSTLR